ncbi:hypothetical protein OSTOST_07294 [Ostertagia ostertagi]
MHSVAQKCYRTTKLLYQKYGDYDRSLQEKFSTSFGTKFSTKDLVVGYRTLVALPIIKNREMGFGNVVMLSYEDTHDPIYVRYVSEDGTVGYWLEITAKQYMDALYKCNKGFPPRKPCKNTRFART